MSNAQVESAVRVQRRLALLVWILFILFWSYCIIAFIKIKLYVLLVCIFHVVMEVYADGVIDFVCQLDANYRQNPPAIKQD
jgi:exosortase/archaeosortase